MITKNKFCDAFIKVGIIFAWILLITFLSKHFLYLLFSSKLVLSLSQIFVYILIVIPVLIFQKIDKFSAKKVGWSFTRLHLQILLGIALGTVLYGIVFLITLFYIESIPSLAQYWKLNSLLIEIGSQIFIIALVEEYIFRGYIQVKFSDVFVKYRFISPILQATLFAAWHYGSGLFGIFYIFLIGLIFGFIREYVKFVKLPSLVVAHGFYNSFYVLIPVFIGCIIK